MKVALAAIAKAEDNYIEEWIRYHLKLGVDDVIIFQNDWRYAGDKTQYGDHVTWIDFDGESRLLPAYNHFVQNFYNKYDFACVFDIDEFLTLRKHKSIKDFLAEYEDFWSIGVNWRLFGDSGLQTVDAGNYSLLNRFTHCQKGLNKHIKLILNFRKCFNNVHFSLPHCLGESYAFNVTVDVNKSHFIRGPFNDIPVDAELPCAYLNHYFCKTRQEWIENKIPKGKCDFPLNHPAQRENWNMQKFYDHNRNEEQDFTAQAFYNG